jgi:hypothetical protein
MTILTSRSVKAFFNSEVHSAEQMPDDATEITPELYQALLQGPANNKVIDFSVVPPALRDPEKVWPTATQLAFLIDQKVALMYQAWTRFTTEYQAKEAAALTYKAASYRGEISIWISSYADAAGIGYKEAAEHILMQAESLRAAQVQVAQLRMRKFELTDLADEPRYQLYEEIVAEIDQVSATVDPFI